MKKTSHWFYVSFPISGYAGHGNTIIKVLSDTYENAIPQLWRAVQRGLRAPLEEFQNQMFDDFHTYTDEYGFHVVAVHDADVMVVES